MSRLYHTETGRIIPALGEELTAWRRVRKVLQLPPTGGPATLFLLARCDEGNEHPLRLALNGVELGTGIVPDGTCAYRWYDVRVDAGAVRRGANTIDCWTDAPAMTAWALAIEPGHAAPGSAVTDDGGGTWRSERMGYGNAVRGEYVVRVRLQEGDDPPPLGMVWEPHDHPRLASLRDLIPQDVRLVGTTLDKGRALATWLSRSWRHSGAMPGRTYTPWDAGTILAWGQARRGHGGQRPVAMCVHYAVGFASFCRALGMTARCSALTGDIGGSDGHFVAEVWCAEYGKWVMVDPNVDATLWRADRPLSLTEIRAAAGDSDAFRQLIEWGPGYAFQRRNAAIARWLDEAYVTGRCFRYRALWPRADFLAHPELTPPGHGTTAYCETDLVWDCDAQDCRLGMFPRFAGDSYFEAPPAGAASAN